MSQPRPLTEDALRAAFARRPAPEGLSFEACKRAAMHWAAVVCEARGLIAVPLTSTTGRHSLGLEPVSTPPPAWMGSLRVSQPTPEFDRKRAAAGEHPDD